MEIGGWLYGTIVSLQCLGQDTGLPCPERVKDFLFGKVKRGLGQASHKLGIVRDERPASQDEFELDGVLCLPEQLFDLINASHGTQTDGYA